MSAQRDKALQMRRLKARIEAELDSLSLLVEEATSYRKRFEEAQPDILALRGMGHAVHDFYTGLERIFEAVAEALEGGPPRGLRWHRELLEDMTTGIPNVRPSVLSPETAARLDEFLRFRHLFRNVYGSEMRWPRLKALLDDLPSAAAQASADLRRFGAFLEEMAECLEETAQD